MCYHKYLPRTYLHMLHTIELSNTWVVKWRGAPWTLWSWRIHGGSVASHEGEEWNCCPSVEVGIGSGLNTSPQVMSTRNLRILPFFFGIRVFADIIKLRMLLWDRSGVVLLDGVTPLALTGGGRLVSPVPWREQRKCPPAWGWCIKWEVVVVEWSAFGLLKCVWDCVDELPVG